MNSERSRILDMLARGVISVKECEEMLAAVEKRIDEKVKRDIERAESSGPLLPIVIIIALIAVPFLAFLAIMSSGILMRGDVIISRSRIIIIFSVFTMLLQGFWIWMLVDCITRQPARFSLYFSMKHENEKLVWLALIAFLNLIGAIAYFISIFIPQEKSEYVGRVKGEKYLPPPSARSLRWYGWTGIILAVFPGLAMIITAVFPPGWDMANVLHMLFSVSSIAFLVLLLWALVFWLWMVIDCAVRDKRDFGAFVANKAVDKAIWLILTILTSIFGGLAYHIVIRRNPAADSDKFRRAFRDVFLAGMKGMFSLILFGTLFKYTFLAMLDVMVTSYNVTMPTIYALISNSGDIAIIIGLGFGVFGLVMYLIYRIGRTGTEGVSGSAAN